MQERIGMQSGRNFWKTSKHYARKQTLSCRKNQSDCTENCSIPEGDQGYLRTNDTNESTSSKREKDAGNNNANTGDGEIG
jgi:hypothetical protein